MLRQWLSCNQMFKRMCTELLAKMPHHLTQLPLWQNPALLASVFGRHPSPRNVLMTPPSQPEQSEASTSQEESVFVPGLTTYMFCFKSVKWE